MKKNEKEFLVGLENLTRETGIVIGGCGCCGSPFISSVDQKELECESSGYGIGTFGEVRWVSPSNKYDWEHCSESIVKDS